MEGKRALPVYKNIFFSGGQPVALLSIAALTDISDSAKDPKAG